MLTIFVDSMANDVPAENTHNNIDHLVLNLPAFPDVSSSVGKFVGFRWNGFHCFLQHAVPLP